jgi:hypothetical protein
MRIALVGWDLDEKITGELARSGAEVVVFTRWFPDQPARESHDGWTKLRCPHAIGGTPTDEAAAFGVAVVRDASTSGVGFNFDIVHALDRYSRTAAAELAGRAHACAMVASLGAAEEGIETEFSFGRQPGADAWICDHPWTAELVRTRLPADALVSVVLAPSALSGLAEDSTGRAEAGVGLNLVVSLPGRSRLSSRVLVEAVKRARETLHGLSVTVFGVGPHAEILRRRLEKNNLIATGTTGSAVPLPSDWNHCVARADLLGVAHRELAGDPVAHLAWLAGCPVVRILSDDPAALAVALRDAVVGPHRDRDAVAGRALARRQLEPSSMASSYLRLYLETLSRKFGPPAPRRKRMGGQHSAATVAFPELRSRLSLTPVSTREVLASWSLRSDDWAAALEWLGPDAIRAVLTVRLFDVTDLTFNGMNAHRFWDVDLGFGETFRLIGLEFEGRSLAACLGLRTQWGYFHPIVHARLCHLPRERFAPANPPRRLRVLPRGISP